MKQGVLEDILLFSNGKSIKPGGKGIYPVFGANGIIGGSDNYNYEDAIILGRVGAYCGAVEKHDGKFWASDNTIVVKPKNTEHDKSYIYFLLKKLNLNNYAGGAAQPLLTQTVLKQVPVFYHNAEKQKEIADVLSSYDDLIENNSQRISILETLAQNIYQEWFVNHPCPEGWEIVELGDLITVKRGKTITKKTAKAGDVPVVAGGLNPAYFHNQANTTAPVITVSASGANAGYVNLYTLPVWASDCSYIDTETTPYVYYYYLLMKSRQVEITRMQTGAAQPHVYPKDLMRLEVPKVPEEKLDEFTEKIMPKLELIANLIAKNENLKQQRDLLLPRLISN